MRDPKIFVLILMFGVMIAFGSLFYKLQDSKTSNILALKDISPTAETQICPNIENGIYDTLLSTQYCIKDADCAIFKFENTCGFGCHKILNKNTNLSEITGLMSEFRSKCGKCDNVCPEPPKSSNLKCVNFQCIDSVNQ